MSNPLVEVLRLVFPTGIPTTDYERALEIVRLVTVAAPGPDRIDLSERAPAGEVAIVDEWIPPIEAALILGVPVKNLYTFASRGQVGNTRREGNRLRLSRAGVEAFKSKRANGS